MEFESTWLLSTPYSSIISQCPPLAGPTLLRKPFFFKVLRFFWTADGFIPIFSASSVFEIDGLVWTKNRILRWLSLISDHLSDNLSDYLSDHLSDHFSSTFSLLSSKYRLLNVTIN